MKKEYDFTGFPKDNFRELMINYWMESENIGREQALYYYGDKDFDELCCLCDGTRLLEFKYEIDNTYQCFEINDNNFVIPVSAIDVYKEPK